MSTPRYFRPLTPLETMRILFGHCKPDSIIGIGSRRPTAKGDVAPHWLYVCRVCRLDALWDSITRFEPQYTKYVVQNPFLSTALSNGTVSGYEQAVVTDTPVYFLAKNNNVSELANVIVDLDVGRSDSDISAEEALEAVCRRIHCGELPLPTLVGFSGRGLYLVYTFRDAHGHASLRTGDSEAQWKSVSRALIRLMGDLNSDGNATRFANWFKLPGTVDTRTGRVIEYGVLDGISESCTPVTYTLDELHREVVFSDDSEIERPTRLRTSTDSPQRTAKIRERDDSSICKGSVPDPSAPHRKRCREILRLNEYRGGMREGCRHMTLRHFYFSRRAELRSGGMHDYAETQQIASDDTGYLNASFRPPVSKAQLRDAIRSFGSTAVYCPRNETVAHDLRVTENEVVALGLTMLIPSSYHARLKSQDRLHQERQKRTEQYAVELLRRGIPVKKAARMLRASPRTLRRWRDKHG